MPLACRPPIAAATRAVRRTPARPAHMPAAMAARRAAAHVLPVPGSHSAHRRIHPVAASAAEDGPHGVSAPAVPAAASVRVHYYREDGDYAGWGLHAFKAAAAPTAWESPLPPSGQSVDGIFWDLAALAESSAPVAFIVHKGEAKDGEGEVSPVPGEAGAAAWVVSGRKTVFRTRPDLRALPRGDLLKSSALWVDPYTIALAPPPGGVGGVGGAAYKLVGSRDCVLAVGAGGLAGGDVSYSLTLAPEGLPASALARFPALDRHIALRVPPEASAIAADLVTWQLAVSTVDALGVAVDATGVQLQGVLDSVCLYAGPLGVGPKDSSKDSSKDSRSVTLWAPTAQRVMLLTWTTPRGGDETRAPMTKGPCGAWAGSIALGLYYCFEVVVYSPVTGRLEMSVATDPYSRALSANGGRSCAVDLSDLTAWAPPGWATLVKPPLVHRTDAAIYELHVRDYSTSDPGTPESLSGTFLAFESDSSPGAAHLTSLAQSGLTHVHLLPVYDFGSVDEVRSNWKRPDVESLARGAPDGEEQQAAVAAMGRADPFNWGYDPVHWGVPDGSYCTQPDGAGRTTEFRALVSALSRRGLRVVVDVVYNHTYASGPSDPYSVLDKCVPGYYHRRSPIDGAVEASACCNNVASEHAMAERLILDDLVHWAVTYKVDGFRFDIMGHLMKSTLLKAQARLESLTLTSDGVDGRSLLLYGEGWDFGEVARGRLGANGSQAMLAGSGIGCFNDRLRDAALGGGPFGDPRELGWATGLTGLEPLVNSPPPPESVISARQATLAVFQSWVTAALAGNLAATPIVTGDGLESTAGELPYGGGAFVGLGRTPADAVNYVSCHDNRTLWDTLALKLPIGLSLDDRARISRLCTALVAWAAAGVPFFHAGDELLRSKSLDRDSYHSGDWFNGLDFTGKSTAWGRGLPVADKNRELWPLMRPLLADPTLAPRQEHIAQTAAAFSEMLAVRKSSPLLRLRTAAEVLGRVRFLSTGPAALPGLIVMQVLDGDAGAPGLPQLDATFRSLLAVFNARPAAAVFESPALGWRPMVLHPALVSPADPRLSEARFEARGRTGGVVVPGLSAVVFVEPRG